MHKVMSLEQLAANRRNAQKSTGPRTDKGKARSSRNNIRHGFFSRDLVLRGCMASEDPAVLEKLRADFYADLKPVSQIERRLVDRMVQCIWLARRVRQFEEASFRCDPPDSGPGSTSTELRYFHQPAFSRHDPLRKSTRPRLSHRMDIVVRRTKPASPGVYRPKKEEIASRTHP